jgi:hypothetical protein
VSQSSTVKSNPWRLLGDNDHPDDPSLPSHPVEVDHHGHAAIRCCWEGMSGQPGKALATIGFDAEQSGLWSSCKLREIPPSC